MFPSPLLTSLPVSQMNCLNVNSSEDIKPPPGLAPLSNMSSYQCSSPGSLSKHICAICGDRSSGTTTQGCLGVAFCFGLEVNARYISISSEVQHGCVCREALWCLQL